MKTYYIYNIITDEFLGTVKASDSIQAELKALNEIEKTSLLDTVYIAAFSDTTTEKRKVGAISK